MIDINDLISKFKELKQDDKITLLMKDIFQNNYTTKVTYIGNLKQHGYISSTAGGWALNGCETYNIPSYTVTVRPYRCSGKWELRISNISDVSVGW